MAESFFVDDGGEFYEKSHGVFRQKSGEIEKDKEILDLHLPSAVRRILQQSQQRLHFNVLSIGSGNGEMDQHIVKIIKEELQSHEKYQHTKIFTRAIEPNAHSVSLYKANIESSHNDDQIVFDVYRKTLEEYRQERLSASDNQMKFDIVHFIHSIYYFDLEETLAYCFEKELQENGQVICVVSDFIIGGVKQCSNKAPYEAFAVKIMKIAENHGWKVDHYIQDYSIDVTEVFDEESSEGNLLLDFLTQTKNFRTTTTEKTKVEDALQVIRDWSIMKDGKRLGKKVDELLFIYQ